MAKRAAKAAATKPAKSKPKQAGELQTEAVPTRRPAKSKAKKGGGGSEKIETTAAVVMGSPKADVRETMKKNFADEVSRLSERVDKAEAELNTAKEKLKERRGEFTKLSRSLRESTKLLADLTAGRPVPRDLFSDKED